MSEATRKIERTRRMLELCEEPGGLWEIMAALKYDYMSQWAKSAPADYDNREQIYHRMRALDDVRAAIERVIADGNNAAAEQEAKSKDVGVKFF